MSRKVAAIAAALCVAGASAAAALAHQGNPNFRSMITTVHPPVEGLRLQVLNGDDRLELRNETGRTVVVSGYAGEPYARLGADGTVEVNARSPATYDNQERYGGVQLPPGVDPKARPEWKLIDRSGRFEWHDHRIHYMSKGTPPQVADRDSRTKVFDWKVPLEVGGRGVTVTGTLLWQPADDGSGAPTAAIAAFVVLLVAGIATVVVVRLRRRRRGEPGEAW